MFKKCYLSKIKQNLLVKIRGIFEQFLEKDELNLGRIKKSKFKDNVKKNLLIVKQGHNSKFFLVKSLEKI